MGIHGALEGLVVGLGNTFSSLIGIVLAISAHKWAEAITVGISIAKAKMSLTTNIVLILTFSIATPIGILFGMCFTNASQGIKAIMNSVSAGTFIYISAVEIFSEEYSGKGQKYGKFAASIVGIVMMIGVWYLEKYTNPEE